MNINIYTEFENNEVTFRLSLPFEFLDINEDEYTNLENSIIYKSETLTVDCDKFYQSVFNVFNQINKVFYNEKEKFEKENINILADDFGNNKIVFDFIKKNKDLKVIFSVEDFKEIVDNLKNESYPNLKIYFKNSDECISYKEFYDMHSKLNEIVNFVNHYNLSQLEKIILIYDIVKSNEYKKENSNEDYGISRNLNQILNSNKIVCVGYSNLIDYLLTNLGIKSNTMTMRYKNKNVGHERNYIYLKDDKYNINGVFFLDATWDSKRNNEYLDNYRYFLKPFNFFKAVTPTEEIISPTKFQLLEKNKEEMSSYVDNLSEFDFIKLSVVLSQLIKEYDKSVGPIFSVQNKTKEEIINIINEIIKNYNKTIPEEAFKNAIYRVRKIEYINGILNKALTEADIDKICQEYYKNSSQIKFLKLFNLYEEPTLDKELEESKASSTEEDLLRMRFLRALKTKLNDFPENDFIKKM
ncbi:MAG: hypothetical protein IKL65_06620 [Bacilli bacterium]|nr:hypothetical protein [Bacilli bacterium]